MTTTQTRLDRERGICRRSERMPLPQALQLARRLGNLAHIHAPEVASILHSPGGDTAVVQWQPTRTETLVADVDRFVAERMARAAAQLPDMGFERIENLPATWVAVNVDGHGEGVHLLDRANAECDCADFRIRCLTLRAKLPDDVALRVKCHHLCALELWLEGREFPTPSPAPAETPEERRARLLIDRERDF